MFRGPVPTQDAVFALVRLQEGNCRLLTCNSCAHTCLIQVLKFHLYPTARQVYRLLELSRRNGTVLVAALATWEPPHGKLRSR
jgi:hypothetical protein